MRIALIGQPNCGKSTIFNGVAGYRSISSNFPGTTVRYSTSNVRLNGLVAELVDFPGSYTLSPLNEAESEIRKRLTAESFDVIVNVTDASQLPRSLLLTLELMELAIPMVLCLNMMDEASRKGLSIDHRRLSEVLGISVVPTIASKNVGISDLFAQVTTIDLNRLPLANKQLICQKDVEKPIEELVELLGESDHTDKKFPPRFLAIKLLEGDEQCEKTVQGGRGQVVLKRAEQLRNELSIKRGKPADTIIALERSALAMAIFRQVASVGKPRTDWRDRIDDLVMHPLWGYAVMILILFGWFYSVFGLGSLIEAPLLSAFGGIELFLGQLLGTGGLSFALLRSGIYGVSGGVAIVLPYLIPFLIVLTLLEDIGYLPRVAYLMDALMHRIGLHGTAVIPAVLGYGCSVPAVMATRILPARRDKVIAAVVATLIPCSARSVVIYGLVAYYLGAGAAMSVYLLNLVVVALTARVLSSLMPEVSPGMVMEVPRYQWPSLRVLLFKVWLRSREFVLLAWPLLILGSILLGVIEYFHWDQLVNQVFYPFTWALGLPAAVGATLIFGVLRKELTLIMLIQTLGTADILSVLTPGQIMVFAIFVTFYVPCVATLAILVRELGVRWAGMVAAITLLLALGLALLTRLAFNVL